ncbi:WXG100 family type VII secretion target [Kitasatospora sp. NPDC056138]|uniref:WXG100 family type VII secretion target n=1 Tax=Kitasatospora sp. NPDC056138 TaxID=3345724 RepID=UPI0035D94518
MEDAFRTMVHEPGEVPAPGSRPTGPVTGLVTGSVVVGPQGAGTAVMAVGSPAPGTGTLTASRGAAAQAAPAAASAGTGIRVSPEQYRTASSPMSAAAERVSELYLSLDEFLTSMNATSPWGKDHAGEQFAEGEKGYLAYSAATLKGLKNLPAALHRIAEGLKTMAQNYESVESGTVADLNGRGQELRVVESLPTPVITLPPAGATAGPPSPAPLTATNREIGRGRIGGGR